MSVYQRYFRITEGPVVDEINRLQEIRFAAAKVFAALGDKYKSKSVNTYESSGRFAGFTFDEKPDEAVFRLLKKHRLWVPRKIGPGKEIWAEINALPQPAPIGDALLLVGLTANLPTLTDNGRWYAPCIWGFGKPRSIWFVSVPWKDVDPAELAQYKLDKAAGTHFNRDLDHLNWEAPADWTEVKNWQIEKEAEELRAAIAAEPAE